MSPTLMGTFPPAAARVSGIVYGIMDSKKSNLKLVDLEDLVSGKWKYGVKNLTHCDLYLFIALAQRL